MKINVLENGEVITRNMTPAEEAEYKAQTKQFLENIKPTVEEEITTLKEDLANLKELFTPLLKLVGSNKEKK